MAGHTTHKPSPSPPFARSVARVAGHPHGTSNARMVSGSRSMCGGTRAAISTLTEMCWSKQAFANAHVDLALLPRVRCAVRAPDWRIASFKGDTFMNRLMEIMRAALADARARGALEEYAIVLCGIARLQHMANLAEIETAELPAVQASREAVAA